MTSDPVWLSQYSIYWPISLWQSHVQFELFNPDTCNPIRQLQGRMQDFSAVALESLASLHGPSEAYRVRLSELWGETILNIKSVHSAGIFLASWPSARSLSVKWREVWMVPLTGWPNLINSNNRECEFLSLFHFNMSLVGAIVNTLITSTCTKAHLDW